MKKLTIIAPDKGSGETFRKKIQEKNENNVEIKFVTIPPRVVNNKITKKIIEVVSALSKAIYQASIDGAYKITISCNMLSLPIFIESAIDLARLELDKKELILPKIITTIDGIDNYLEKNQERIVLLGVKPLSEILAKDKKRNYHTLSELKNNPDKDLNLVQEIIWHIKYLQDSDVSTAPNYIKILSSKDENNEMLLYKLQQLHELLLKLKVQKVIMGCTELPDAFQILEQKLGQLPYELIDPAELVSNIFQKEISKSMKKILEGES